MQRARHSKIKEEMGVCYKRNVILQKIFKTISHSLGRLMIKLTCRQIIDQFE